MVKIDITDNAGLFCEDKMDQSKGHGIQLANDLIKAEFNSNNFGVSWNCISYKHTTVTLTLPFETETDEPVQLK